MICFFCNKDFTMLLSSFVSIVQCSLKSFRSSELSNTHDREVITTFNLNIIVTRYEVHNLSGLLRWGALDRLESETILESSVHFLQVPHSTSTGRVPPLGLHAPVELSDLLFWVCARGTLGLLNVVRASATSSTQGVCLVVTLTKR